MNPSIRNGGLDVIAEHDRLQVFVDIDFTIVFERMRLLGVKDEYSRRVRKYTEF